MIKVKTKMDRCLYVKIQNVKLRKIFNERPMHVALIVRKMTLFGKGKEAVYRCVCGHTETQSQMDKRMREKRMVKCHVRK